MHHNWFLIAWSQCIFSSVLRTSPVDDPCALLVFIDMVMGTFLNGVGVQAQILDHCPATRKSKTETPFSVTGQHTTLKILHMVTLMQAQG